MRRLQDLKQGAQKIWGQKVFLRQLPISPIGKAQAYKASAKNCSFQKRLAFSSKQVL